MQIIIPMSGFGERFRRAGYTVPKPLIEVEGKPIIAHIVDMFPGETDITFICNREHLHNLAYNMEQTLLRHCPTGRIIGIPPHKLGPVNAIIQVEHFIDMQRPVVVNYCDFTCYWDWGHFKKFVMHTKCTGAIPAYNGFHPHSLGTTNYAYMQELNGWVKDIQEKKPYTNNRMDEFASSGTYYFSSGKVMFDAFHACVERKLDVGGEYYVSLAYKPLLASHEPVAVYPLQHFMQWGTPEDVAEYLSWSKIFHALLARQPRQVDANGSVIIPMAGLGQRFFDQGYTQTKPLIPVSGKPMVIQAVSDLPPSKYHVFVTREDMLGHADITAQISEAYPHAIIESLPAVTKGQACTALLGLEALERTLGVVPGPITIGACDNGALYQSQTFQRLVDTPEVDVLVWGVRGHTNAVRHPEMFGWIDEQNGHIRSVSVKTPLASPKNDPIVLGTFTFKKPAHFQQAVTRLISSNRQINGEFYIDSCINVAIELGLNCHLFEVDHFLCWGTPNDLRTFEYWQSCFHKWSSHPYRLELDIQVPPSAVTKLAMQFQAVTPSLLAPVDRSKI